MQTIQVLNVLESVCMRLRGQSEGLIYEVGREKRTAEHEHRVRKGKNVERA